MQDACKPDKNFSPKGSIVFFILLLITCAVIWFSVYYLQMNKV